MASNKNKLNSELEAPEDIGDAEMGGEDEAGMDLPSGDLPADDLPQLAAPATEAQVSDERISLEAFANQHPVTTFEVGYARYFGTHPRTVQGWLDVLAGKESK